VVGDKVLVYAKAGYANWKQTTTTELEGLRVGGGVEVNVTKKIYGGLEYRYTDFNRGVGQHGALVRIGTRF
jgi:opacity protein-like surface antigen